MGSPNIRLVSSKPLEGKFEGNNFEGEQKTQIGGRDGGGGGGSGMDARITKLEADLTALQVDVRVIRATMATKEDVGKVSVEIANLAGRFESSLHAQTTKFIAWMLGAVGLISLLAGIVMALVKVQP